MSRHLSQSYIPRREQYQQNFNRGKKRAEKYIKKYIGNHIDTSSYIIWANPRDLEKIGDTTDINYKTYQVTAEYHGREFNWPFANFIRGKKFLLKKVE